jgi:hypothetical protein
LAPGQGRSTDFRVFGARAVARYFHRERWPGEIPDWSIAIARFAHGSGRGSSKRRFPLPQNLDVSGDSCGTSGSHAVAVAAARVNEDIMNLDFGRRLFRCAIRASRFVQRSESGHYVLPSAVSRTFGGGFTPPDAFLTALSYARSSAIASRCAASVPCWYMRRVIAGCAWPASSATTFSGTPCSISRKNVHAARNCEQARRFPSASSVDEDFCASRLRRHMHGNAI